MQPPTQTDIRDKLNRMSGLSPAVMAILPRLGDDDFDTDEFARLLGQDPVLAARVLRMANSPFYGLPRQVGSLREAVLILGFGSLRGLLLATGLIGAFADEQAMTRSLATAGAANALARSLGKDPGQAFTAGLLHNLGALLLSRFAPDHWRERARDTDESELARRDRERRVLGYDHCELAADIAGHWRFPAAIQSALRLHPYPADEPAEPLVDIVHVAWVIVARGAAGECPDLSPTVSARLGLDTEGGQLALTEAVRVASIRQQET